MLSFTLSGKHILYRNTNTNNSNRYQNLQEFISHIYIHSFSCNKFKLVQISLYGTELMLITILYLLRNYSYGRLILIQILFLFRFLVCCTKLIHVLILISSLYLFRSPIGVTELMLILLIREYSWVLQNLIRYRSTHRYYRTYTYSSISDLILVL